MHVVAEGIEHAEQLGAAALDRLRVRQGYLFARPMDGDELEPVIMTWDAEHFAADELRIPPPGSLRHAA